MTVLEAITAALAGARWEPNRSCATFEVTKAEPANRIKESMLSCGVGGEMHKQ